MLQACSFPSLRQIKICCTVAGWRHAGWKKVIDFLPSVFLIKQVNNPSFQLISAFFWIALFIALILVRYIVTNDCKPVGAGFSFDIILSAHKKVCMKKLNIFIFCLLSFTLINAQTSDDAFKKPLKDIISEIEKRYDVKIRYPETL